MKKLLAFLILAMLCMTFVVAASAETFINPVGPGADPFVFKDDDGTYYLYATTGDAYGYRVFSSTNLVEWNGEGYCLLGKDIYQKPASDSYYGYWAPEVIKYDGKYYMVYTVNEHLGIAVSDSPLGPFVNDKANEGFLFEDKLRVLDGSFFLDDDGVMYLYFVTVDNASFNGVSSWSGSHIWGGVLNMDTLKMEQETIVRVQSFKWSGIDENVVEGPFMLKHGGKYYLTFSSGDYRNVDYAVCCAVGDSPLGKFTRYDEPILECDDLERKDTEGEHLYGTAHHSFTTSPDGKELIIVYHAHRTGWTYGAETDANGKSALVGPRVVCLDRAGFDEDGMLWAGTEEKGTPTVAAQDLPSGGTLTRKTHYEGVFANVANKTVYVAYYDGVDTNDGLTYRTPVKTIEKAAEILKTTGGTIALIQDYVVNHGSGDTAQYLDIPACDKPIIIKAADEKSKDIILTYKFMSINSDVYFDNIIFAPEIGNNISIVECNFNNVVFGDGVSCLSSPHSREFAFLCGGKWWYTGSDSNAVYASFKYANQSAVTTTESYSLKVYGGSWSVITAESMKDRAPLSGSAVNATLTLGDGIEAMSLPAKTSGIAVTAANGGVTVTFNALAGVDKYQIRRNGKIIGYTETTEYVDTDALSFGDYSYTAYGYVNGCCVGQSGTAAVYTARGDMDNDGDVDLADVVLLAKAMLDGELDITLADVFVVLRSMAK